MHLPDFSKTRVLIVGDLMLDRYWKGSTGRISPEAPVPVVKVGDSEDRPGGAANVAINAATLGDQVTVIGPTGIAAFSSPPPTLPQRAPLADSVLRLSRHKNSD